MRKYIVEYAMFSHEKGKEMVIEAENKEDAWLEAIHHHYSGSSPAWAIVRGVMLKGGRVKLFTNTDYKHPY